MHPPEWVVREVERVNPNARLGWLGKEEGGGEFVVLDLVPHFIAKNSVKTRWENRGPIFGSRFDTNFRIPLWVENIDIPDVMSGKVLLDIARWMTPLRDRLAGRYLAERDRIDQLIRDQAGEMGSEMYWRAQRSTEGGTATHIPNKHVTDDEWRRVSGDWKEHINPDPEPAFPTGI